MDATRPEPRPPRELPRWEDRRGRFHEDAAPRGSAVVRLLWVLAGFVFLGLGALGAFLPVLPTTPFVLVAAACFARSSPRFYAWLMDNRVFGPVIWQWQQSRTIPARAKAVAVTLVVLTIGSSVVFFVPHLGARVAMSVVGVAVVAWLLSVPSRR
ncbi:MAG: YbaN family protein [Myxococcota bacterium]